MNHRLIPILSIALPILAQAQSENTAAKPVPFQNTIEEAQDVHAPGTVTIYVDATDVTRAIFRVHEKIPIVKGGPVTLLYPKWLPGHHSDSGQVSQLGGLVITSGGKTIPWQRDPVDVCAFHVDVPPDAEVIEAVYQFLAPTDVNQGRIVATPDMLNMEWSAVVLYPAGFYARDIDFDATVEYPEGWKDCTALDRAYTDHSTVHYKTVPLDVLVDSPIMAGANVRVVELSPKVHLDIIADQPEQLAATDEQIALHKNLVTQAVKLFGAEHYNHYDFLLAMSDRQSGIGLEHHRSSEDGVGGAYFTEWKDNMPSRNLLPHEYTHSWDGKYRRPADLWTPDYRAPMRDSLLWVYEGQTQFWGYVLGARSGLYTKEETLGALASIAAHLDTDAGRKWRPLEDTTDDPIISQRRPKAWRSYQRSEDYYNEGMLIWMDADSLIREMSHGTRSMDDFAKAFFGMRDGDYGELTYTFDDVVHTLNEVQPNDWATFLHKRLDEVSDHAPLDGFTRGGYKLVYTNTPSEWFKAFEKSRKTMDLTFSGGLVMGKEGEITQVVWDSPAFNAGLTVGTKIIAVNGHTYDNDKLKAAIKGKKPSISLLVKTGDVYRTVELKYDGGLRYPMFEKTGTGPATLDVLLSPRN